MSFVLPRLFWIFGNPLTLLLAAFCVGVGLAVVWRTRRVGFRVLFFASLILVALAVLPIGRLMLEALEDRFPHPASFPERVDGVVMLGGAFHVSLAEARDEVSLNDGAERLFAFMELARRYPHARLAFAGGSGQLSPGRLTEAALLVRALAQAGFADERLVLEDRSRTTWENALLLREVAQPQPGERWLLVTSAWHMPRAVGSFRGAGWDVIAWPVDYRTFPGAGLDLGFSIVDGLEAFEIAAREWIGLAGYRLLGRTAALFPAP
jgi:uncharacterized SAM-binding protein YcdF (DUF218 family)